MLIGIMSDSHGRVQPVRDARALFDELGVQHIVHCGDVGGQAVFEELVGLPLTFVWGNTDHPSQADLAFLASVGMPVPDTVPTCLTLADRRLAVFHGHERAFLDAALHFDVDYILHGHTHIRRDEQENGCRIINPGALHRAMKHTVASLDLSRDELAFHTVGH